MIHERLIEHLDDALPTRTQSGTVTADDTRHRSFQRFQITGVMRAGAVQVRRQCYGGGLESYGGWMLYALARRLCGVWTVHACNGTPASVSVQDCVGVAMSRYVGPLRPQDGPAARLVLNLRALRDRMGATAPSIREISEREGIGTSTLYHALTGNRLPTTRTMAALVRHWGGDESEWIRMRSQAEAELSVTGGRSLTRLFEDSSFGSAEAKRAYAPPPPRLVGEVLARVQAGLTIDQHQCALDTIAAVVDHDLRLAHQCEGYDPYGVAREIAENRIMPMVVENERFRRKLQAVEEDGSR